LRLRPGQNLDEIGLGGFGEAIESHQPWVQPRLLARAPSWPT
jgi:hypothetical protein